MTYPTPEHPAAAEAFARTRELLNNVPKMSNSNSTISATSSKDNGNSSHGYNIPSRFEIASLQIHSGIGSSSTSSQQLQQYHQQQQLQPSHNGFLAPMGSVVGLRNVVAHPPTTEDEVLNTSLLTPNRGHHALFRALEELEGWEKQEAEWLLQNPQTPLLTTIVTGDDYASPRQAIDTLEALCQTVPRRVCQHPFKRNDIVWVCRTCQADETCVLCHRCFKQSNHEGHDVAFYHAQAGGCCDCGDPDAWDPAGFCPHHGPAASQGLGPLSPSTVHRVEGVVPAVIDWMVEQVAHSAEEGHQRAQPQPHPALPSNTPLQPPTAAAPIAAASAATDGTPHDSIVSHHNSTGGGGGGRRILPGNLGLGFDPAAAGSHKAVRSGGRMMSGIGPGLDDGLVDDGEESDDDAKKKMAGDSLTAVSAVAAAPPKYTKAERLGILAREGGGLFLVLKSDDIHTTHQWVDALRDLLGTSSLYTDSILQKLVRALRQYGQLVVWGTMELLAELNPTQIHLWLDGDRVASGLLGTAMLSRALLLNSHGLYCSIVTLEELQLEQRAVAVLQWLTCLARSCDPLCQTVAESIGPERHLVPLLRADFKLSSRVTKYWHSLLLTLLAVPTFKSHLAAAYCDTYQVVTSEYARGMGVLERSGYALSVQFLNRVTYVKDLVQHRALLDKLGASLLQTLQVAAQPRLNPNHPVLTHRRYSPCISDLKCVLNVKGMPRLFASQSGTFLHDWIAALALGQMMDPQAWREFAQGHVEIEVRGWVGAFNASISLGSLFERLLSWDDDDPSPIDDPNSPLSKNLRSCVELTVHVLTNGVTDWQNREMATYRPTPYTASLEPFQRRPASLPFSTVSAKHGSVLAFSALPMSQMTPFSFHLPLHRFVAACLREVGLRENGLHQMQALLKENMSPSDHDALFAGLMEFPLLVLTRAAQVRAGLWRRNGNGLNDQVLNYAEPPFCRAMRDADVLLVQFGMLGRTHNQTRDLHRPDSDVGVCFLIHLMLHRLGLFDFCGLAKAPNSDINLYLDEVQQGFYQAEQNSEDAMGDDFLLPWTYSPAKDASSCLLLLEEFLHTIIILSNELPPVPPGDRSDHTAQAKWRLRREVVHRLASGHKTHSELAEVHHVLSHWDNVYLSEEGKLLNPDDATGAALGVVLAEVATRKISRAKMEPDKWQLNRSVWEEYDPSFFHISLRHHQTAAESRPLPKGTNVNYGVVPMAFCPKPAPAHSAFSRLRRDISCDCSLLAIAYRTLHMHCRDVAKKKDVVDLRGALAYEGDERSETALARAVHILTLGAFAWQDARSDDKDWRQRGGGSIGSIFFDRGDDDPAPTAKEWVSLALLANPKSQQACEWYEGEESTLQILRRLAVDGGYAGCFIAQDRGVRAGAAWLCDFAAERNAEARNLVHLKQVDKMSEDGEEKQETELQKRKRMAKEKAMQRMQAQAAKFATMMEEELGDKDENDGATGKDEMQVEPSTPRQPSRQGSFGSAKSSGSSVDSATDSDRASTPFVSSETGQPLFDEMMIPSRLLRNRPQCIICSDDSNAEGRNREREDEGHRKSRRRRTDGGNALAFVGYTQASTVMKGGGGPPSTGSIYTATAPVRRFVGAHVALCGHAVHSECWESYLATVSHREDRIIGKRDEFRCPLCQRLSNCLVPFIDVGVDWIDYATCIPVSSESSSVANSKGDTSSEEMSIEPAAPTTSASLKDFLACTPWWVSRHNKTVVWDGQCAFVSDSPPKDEVSEQEQKQVTKSPRRRSVRPLRKKDLYAAWNAMMKTPRFVRRKLRPRSEINPEGTNNTGDGTDIAVSHFAVSMESAGETVVWRRFMDQVSDITYRADGKRLSDENLHNDFGEFRHYIVEKYAYNMANRFAGKEPSDWPSCVFPSTLSDTQRQELSREKLLSKLTMSMQAFTYSVCCEANEARRLAKKALAASSKSAGMPRDENNLDLIFSKYGISGIACDGKLVIMPLTVSTEEDGTQPFNGRLGRLRYLGLSVMAAAGAVAADLVQLVLPFPLEGRGTSNANLNQEMPHRSPIVYPILYGHVLTHVVAAICASSGRARARSDSLELVWPVPFSSRGSFVSSEGMNMRKNVDSVVEDSEGFLKLGLLARVLQVLLGKLDMQGLDNIPDFETEVLVAKILRELRATGDFASPEGQWRLVCITLLQMALSEGPKSAEDGPKQPHVESAIADRLNEGCSLAADAACSYLADIGTVLQILLPGVMARYTTEDIETTYDSMNGSNSLVTLEKLRNLFRLEPVGEMLQSDAIHVVVAGWYEDARRHSKAATLPSDTISGSGAAVCGRLFRTQGFRVFDWPMESCQYSISVNPPVSNKKDPPPTSNGAEPQDEVAVPMEIDTIQPAGIQTSTSELISQQAPALVTFSSKKSVPLIGGYALEPTAKSSGRPRVARIPTSYTDLYAELGQLLPDSEQTAVCLICGEVLNAGGKGECTRHSLKCGAGTGMFFLLQECAGLIMHNGKAAYIHSPFVDSHGETPQYRGRPLNLDLDRYDHLQEVWSGHAIRQQVVAERGGSRQVIVPDFY